MMKGVEMMFKKKIVLMSILKKVSFFFCFIN